MANILISDLRKGNLVNTEHGILPVYFIAFDSIQVKGSDGRTLWANKFEGVLINDEILSIFKFTKYDDGGELNGSDCFYVHKKTSFSIGLMPKYCLVGYNNVKFTFAHELQNIFYWLKREELYIL